MSSKLYKKIIQHSFSFSFQRITKQAFSTWFYFLKVMIPVLFFVKFLQYFELDGYFAEFFKPLMVFLGLPVDFSYVWVVGMLANIYAAVVIFFQFFPYENLTLLQVSVIGIMIATAHSLLIEIRVCNHAGIKIWFLIVLRIGSAIWVGWLVKNSLASFSYYQQSPTILIPNLEIIGNQEIIKWLKFNLINLVEIFLIIWLLYMSLALFKWIGITNLIELSLKSVLKIFGISANAIETLLVGLLLGLTYGGKMIIDEAKSGKMNRKDIFVSLCFLSICHSIVEDTLLIMVMGADFSVLMFYRLAFSLVLIFILAKLYEKQHSLVSKYCFTCNLNKLSHKE